MRRNQFPGNHQFRQTFQQFHDDEGLQPLPTPAGAFPFTAECGLPTVLSTGLSTTPDGVWGVPAPTFQPQPRQAGFCEERGSQVEPEVSSPCASCDSNDLVGGRIASHIKEWEKITSDAWVLNSVRGVTIPFEEAVWKEPLTSWPDVKLPPQTNKFEEVPVQESVPHPYRLGEEEVDFVCQEIGRM